MASKAGKLARRYAKALLTAVTTSKGNAQEVASMLRAVAKGFGESKEFHLAILTPMFPRAQREKALKALLQQMALPETVGRFVHLLFELDRLEHLADIADAFQVLADRAAGVVQVEIITARALSDGDRQDAEAIVTKMLKGAPQFQWVTDPALIGGMCIRYEGKVIDGSVQGRLERLERELLA